MPINPQSVERQCGCVLVRATDGGGSRRRYWFDRTEADRLLFSQEVVHVEETGARSSLDDESMHVPPLVRATLATQGYETILDADGRPL